MKRTNINISNKSKGIWVISVGAGPTQLPFINSLKSKGYSIIAFGKGRNDLRAVNLCDHFKEIDTSKSEEAIEWIKSLHVELKGAGSYAGGHAINTLQDINKYFNLPTNIPGYLSVGMDKYKQQKLYEEYGLTSIKTFKPNEILNNKELISGIDNFIIKPSIGRGSVGVEKVNQEELYNIIDNNNLSDTDMVQEFKRGEEYRMLIIIQDRKIKLLAPIKRESFNRTFLLGRLSYNSNEVPRIEKYIAKMIRELKLKDAIIKADVIVNEEDINMIEMDIGVGGGNYYKTYISHLYNYDIEEEYIKLIIGEEVGEAKDCKDKIVMDYIYNMSGEPITYDQNTCVDMLSEFLSSEKTILIPNAMQSQDNSKCESNADFIFCVIHNNNNNDLHNLDINNYVNKEIFKKSKEEDCEN